MPDSSNPLLSIIIPVHNQSSFTRSCIAALISNPPDVPFEIVLVDDGSTDDTPQLLRCFDCEIPNFRHIHNNISQGFAGACNRGAESANGDYLLFLNNDTEVLAGWFPPLFAALRYSPDIGIVGPKLVFPDGTIQHCGKVWHDPFLPNSHPHHIYYRFPEDHPAVNKSRDYSLLTGACLLVRRKEFRDLGGFDENYENGWEDDDLCCKYGSIGKRVHYCATSRVIHHQNKTLNERMNSLESMLPPYERIRELDQALVDKRITDADLAQAEQLLKTYTAMEQELKHFQNRFQRNRNRFFQKWGTIVKRDDYIYCNQDNVPLNKALQDAFPSSDEQPPDISGLPRHEDGPAPLVSIVILTFNRLDVTKECITSIQNHTPENHEIIFVDNGSTDGTLDWLRSVTEETNYYHLIVNGTNLGFSKGCNQGIAASRGQFILLLNNDTRVTPQWLSGMLECFVSDAIGIVGPMSNNISGIQQWPWSDYKSMAMLDGFAAEFRQRNRYRRIESRRIVGFCMLFRRELIDRIGLLDEQFGSGNFEDDDYCLRAGLEGYTNIIAADVFIHHVGSASFSANRIDYTNALLGNQAIFNKKWSQPIEDELLVKKIVRLKTLELAELQRLRGETNEAVDTLLQEGLRQLPEEPEFYIRLAKIFLEADMGKDAFDVLSESPSHDFHTVLLKGKALLSMGRISEATQLVDELHSCIPELPGLSSLQGMIHIANSDFVLAGNAFEKAIHIDPASAEAYVGLAALAEEAGEKALSLNLLERGAIIATSDPVIRTKYLRTALASQEYARTERFIEEARHFFPDDIQLMYAHIDILLKQERWHAAMIVIEQALPCFRHKEGFVDAALAVRLKIGSNRLNSGKYAKGQTVSLCMIVKNEEKNLPRCLASLKPIVDEIIVVDTGSTDRTKEIANIYGAEVFDAPWTGDYAAARNTSLDKAHGNWILAMDADEVISSQDYSRFRAMIDSSSNKQVAFSIVTRNYTNKVDIENWQANRGEYPKEEAARGWMPSDKVRLFPNSPLIRFENAIHEMVEPSLVRLGIPDMRADIVVHHYGYMDERRQTEKKVLYYELGKKKMADSGGTPAAICELAIQAAGIGRYDEAIALWKRILAIDPNSYLAHFNLGYAYLQTGKFQEGRAASRQAMELRSNYREAIINYSICELCLGNGEMALQTIENALPENNDYPSLLLMRGVIYACLGSSRLALNDFRNLRNCNVEFNQFIHESATKLILAGRANLAANLVNTASSEDYCLPETLKIITGTQGLK